MTLLEHITVAFSFDIASKFEHTQAKRVLTLDLSKDAATKRAEVAEAAKHRAEARAVAFTNSLAAVRQDLASAKAKSFSAAHFETSLQKVFTSFFSTFVRNYFNRHICEFSINLKTNYVIWWCEGD